MAVTKTKNDKSGTHRWRVTIQPGGRTGKQIKRIFKTQAEAKQFEIWAKGQHQQVPEWEPVKADQRRLKQLIALWYAAHGQGLSAGKNTNSRLVAMAEKMENPQPGQVRERFNTYRQARIDEGKSLATVNREHSYLRSVFNELKRLGEWTQANPIGDIRQFKIQEQELSYLTRPQIVELLNELKKSRNPHALLIAKIALSTGGRWAECETLQKTQVRSGQIQFANATKSKKARSVPISEALESEIQEHIKNHPTETGRIFDSAYGAFISALERTSITLPPGQASHVLRHTFATEFMERGGNILTLQRVLGHSDLKMTMRYAHRAPNHLQEVLRLNPLANENSVGRLSEASV